MRTPHQLNPRVALEDYKQALLEHKRATEKLRRRRLTLDVLIKKSAKIDASDGKEGGEHG